MNLLRKELTQLRTHYRAVVTHFIEFVCNSEGYNRTVSSFSEKFIAYIFIQIEIAPVHPYLLLKDVNAHCPDTFLF
jgi:hypothetical protein